MSAVHFGLTSNPVKLVMLHANGFNALAYRSVLEPLGVHTIALDMRGHGMSTLPTDIKGLKSWYIFRDDVLAFFERYIDRPVVIAGHSYGGAVAALAAPALKDKISGYAGFDPVMVPLLFRFWPYIPGGRAFMKKYIPIARAAGRRRYVFESFEAAFARYKGRGAFKGFTDQALRDYLEGGLKLHPDGVQLACHPLWEQAIFAAQGQNVFRHLSVLPENSSIHYAGAVGAISTPGLRRYVGKKLKSGDVTFHADFGHLFPFHHPDFTVSILSQRLQQASLRR